jgi:two-component system, chemotaxis family, protein-glutamate methylesterase/glutaminase
VNQVIRTLVVDDSAFVRKSVREMLSRSPYIEVVGAARDGLEALEMCEKLKPDVVTCDLTMPGLDGPGFVRQQMVRRPLPILILSVANGEAAHAIEALEAGAVDFVQKPTALATDDLLRIREELIEKVKAAAHVPVGALVEPDRRDAKTPTVAPKVASRIDIVTIAVSTGGPQALRTLLPRFPASFPIPMAVVLHMPIGFTALYASKLNDHCSLEVREAADGDELRPGVCLFAQAGRHLELTRATSRRAVCRFTIQPINLLHRPSADVLFRSAADVYGDRVLGVVMTGMGSDGREGAAWIKAKGGTVLTEAEESCIIYGMPRAVVEAGASDASVPLSRMAEAIMERL